MQITITEKELKKSYPTATGKDYKHTLQKMDNGAIAIGWGSNHHNAIMACINDIKTIIKLK